MPSPLAVDLLTPTQDDLPFCFALVSAAFKHDAPFVDMFFPEHDTPAGAGQGTLRLQAWQKAAPDVHFLVARSGEADAANSGIVGFAVWTLMKEPPPSNLEEAENIPAIWARFGSDAVEYAKELWASYVVLRSQAIKESKGKGVWVLELLAVHPQAQRRNVGETLVRWGAAQADQHMIEAVVEATPIAVKLYEKCGFRVLVENIPFTVSEKFFNKRKPELVFLKRQLGCNQAP